MTKVETTEVAKEKKTGSTLSNIKILTTCAMCIALTYVMTAFLNIRLPIQANGGLIHLGNVALFISAMVFGKKVGAIAGGIGMALFDLFGGWLTWAPFTLVIVGLMGFVAGWITEKNRKPGIYVLAVVFALFIKIAGYYAAEGILYGNWIAPLTSIPGNVIQVVVGGVIAFPIVIALRKIFRR